MTETIKRVIEDLTKDCTQEDKAKILQFVTPEEPGKDKERVKMDYTPEEAEKITPILEEIAAALKEEKENLAKLLRKEYGEKPARGEDLKKAAAKEGAKRV